MKKVGSLPLIEPIISNDDDDIESHFGKLKVDFANMYIGGGCLHSGCVQEEIMFANHP